MGIVTKNVAVILVAKRPKEPGKSPSAANYFSVKEKKGAFDTRQDRNQDKVLVPSSKGL